MAAIWKAWRQIENPTSSNDAYFLEEHALLPNFIPIRFETTVLGFFENGRSQQEEQQEHQQAETEYPYGIRSWSKNEVLLISKLVHISQIADKYSNDQLLNIQSI